CRTPERPQFVRGACPLELPDREAMSLVEQFVQQLGGTIVLLGELDRLLVQPVIRRLRGVEPALGKDSPQFGGRKTGADDRAVQRRRQLPELAPFRPLRKRRP